MIAGIAADVVVLIHLGFIVFVMLGGLLVIKWRKVAWFHLPCAFWGAFIELYGGICPLTPLENWLRLAASEAPYTSGFIEHYIAPIIYPTNLTPNIQLILGMSVIVVNLVFYSIVIYTSRSRG
jgi:hypothetical protein